MLQVRKAGLLEDTETTPTMRETRGLSSWFPSGVLRSGFCGGGRGGRDGVKWSGSGQNVWQSYYSNV